MGAQLVIRFEEEARERLEREAARLEMEPTALARDYILEGLKRAERRRKAGGE